MPSLTPRIVANGKKNGLVGMTSLNKAENFSWVDQQMEKSNGIGSNLMLLSGYFSAVEQLDAQSLCLSRGISLRS